MAGPAFRAAAVRVRVPATSANLGPGFDALGLSLGLYDDVVVRVADSGLHVDIAGEGAETLPRDESHLLVRSLRTAFDLLGGQPRGLEVVCANRIPHGRGLGSSSAAICAGIVAARAVTIGGDARLDDAALLELATEIEGHPDNVAACLLGGFTLAWMDGGRGPRDQDGPRAIPSFRWSSCPARPVLTETARGLLPRTVPHVDAAANAGRAALLVEALTRRPELLLAATEDRLHQEYRAPAMPESVALVNRLRADGVPAVISGAGPTVLALVEDGAADKVARTGGRGVGRQPARPSTPRGRASCRSARRRGRRERLAGEREGECLLEPVVLTSSLHSDVFVARCFVSPIRDHHSSGSLPNCLRSLPEQFRARSGTGTTPHAPSQQGPSRGISGRNPSHVACLSAVPGGTTAPARSGSTRSRTAAGQHNRSPSQTGRRPLQGRTLRERHHRSDGRDCRQHLSTTPRPPQVLPLAPPHGAAAPAPASTAWSWPSCSRSRPASASGAPRGCARAS